MPYQTQSNLSQTIQNLSSCIHGSWLCLKDEVSNLPHSQIKRKLDGYMNAVERAERHRDAIGVISLLSQLSEFSDKQINTPVIKKRIEVVQDSFDTLFTLTHFSYV